MRFIVQVEGQIEADDLNDAFALLTLHFARLAAEINDGRPVFLADSSMTVHRA